MTLSNLPSILGPGIVAVTLGMLPFPVQSQPEPERPGAFPPGRLQRIDQLPPGPFRADLERLPAGIRAKALEHLATVHLTLQDFETLQVGHDGMIDFVDPAPDLAQPVDEDPETPPVGGSGSIPIDPFPSQLHFHSKPGALNVLYLDFDGEIVESSHWTGKVGRSRIPAVPFDTDGDPATFSSAEQTAIHRIWQRVAEDFAPFNLDVTTERPANMHERVGHVLITRSADANGDPNPSASGGGTASLNVFGQSSYPNYRPAWVYYDNLARREDYISEASSHEFGHNLGLTHDGTTSTAYYGGHGDGETSWGPIMGTGYRRNVSQWSRGEYYQANNSQDDLALMAGKLAYRSDDHGNTTAAASTLVAFGGTQIQATTPETDPDNLAPENKGYLERTSDVDVFSFTTGSGPVSLRVSPLLMPSNTRGGNLDISLELYDNAGRRLLTANPAGQTDTMIETTLSEGVYFLFVRNAAEGSPNSSSPTGYADYGSVGQYFITGTIVASDFVIPPQASLQIADIEEAGVGPHRFTVTYTDNTGIDMASIDDLDLRITGPQGYDRNALRVSVSNTAHGTPRTATYEAVPPNGSQWTDRDAGTYLVWLQPDQVSDVEGAFAEARLLGEFTVSIPQVIYNADMDEDPAWTLEAGWEFGRPNYSNNGPSGGLTGENVVAYNLDGDYEDRISTQYATTPKINTRGADSLTLRFRRWLRLSNNDAALIEVSTNGIGWTVLWSTGEPVLDSEWREVQYTLPSWTAATSSLQIRWGLSSGPSRTDIGWNIDDVEILGGGFIDTAPPTSVVSAPDLTAQGTNLYSFSITYFDASGVRVASLDSSDLRIVGPNNVTHSVLRLGVDSHVDGSPRTATYAVAPPNGAWLNEANGTYQIIVVSEEVSDLLNNAMPETLVGTFEVNIPPSQQRLVVTPTTLNVAEGASATFTVQLFEAPLFPVTVNVTKLSGDPDLTLTGPTSLVFDANDWATPVSVEIRSVRDFDKDNGFAVFECISDDLGSISVLVMEVDTTIDVTLSTLVNHTNWGAVTPMNGVYPSGSILEIHAFPNEFFTFSRWQIDESTSVVNPLTLTLETNTTVTAIFSELTTANHDVPHWWLAQFGYTQDLESAVDILGANGLPLWQSYVAGLNAQDPNDRLRLIVKPDLAADQLILRWSTVTGRVYTILSKPALGQGFEPLPTAYQLPASVTSITNRLNQANPSALYILQVGLEK